MDEVEKNQATRGDGNEFVGISPEISRIGGGAGAATNQWVEDRVSTQLAQGGAQQRGFVGIRLGRQRGAGGGIGGRLFVA